MYALSISERNVKTKYDILKSLLFWYFGENWMYDYELI